MIAREGAATRRVFGELPALLGRSDELAVVGRTLFDGSTRLVTFTGPGGVGKSYLARAVAEACAPSFANRVWFVDLARAREPGALVPCLARSLGIAHADSRSLPDLICDFFGGLPGLLVLDTFDLVRPAAPLLERFLADCPQLVILVTCRSPLGLYAEQRLPVGPLTLPALGRAWSDEVAAPSPAVALFAARARAMTPSFTINEDNVAAIAALCRWYDGLPLFIELLAEWTTMLSPTTLLAYLQRRWLPMETTLTNRPERQRSPTASVQWSYDQLGEGQRRLFRSLGIFTDAFSLSAANHVVAAAQSGPELLAELRGLVQTSLVQASDSNDDGEPVFWLYRPAHDFARAQLEAAGEVDDVARRHAEFYVQLAERAASELISREQLAWFDRFDRERPNLEAAVDWAIERAGDLTGLRLVAALWPFWLIRGDLTAGRRRLELALGAAPGPPDQSRVQAAIGGALLATLQGDHARARQLTEAALAIGLGLPDQSGVGETLVYLALIAGLEGEFERAVILAEEAVALARPTGLPRSLALALLSLGWIRLLNGRWEQAAADLAESSALLRELGETLARIAVLAMQAVVAEQRGYHANADAALSEALGAAQAAGETQSAFFAVVVAAGRLARRGAYALTAQLVAALDSERQRVGLALPEAQQAIVERAAALARSVLGEAGFTAAYARGRELSLAWIVDEALAALNHPQAPEPAAERVEPVERVERSTELASQLSRREREVLALVANGLSNAQIARQLVITPRTAKFHLASIMAKLGARNRAQAVALANQLARLDPESPPDLLGRD